MLLKKLTNIEQLFMLVSPVKSKAKETATTTKKKKPAASVASTPSKLHIKEEPTKINSPRKSTIKTTTTTKMTTTSANTSRRCSSRSNSFEHKSKTPLVKQERSVDDDGEANPTEESDTNGKQRPRGDRLDNLVDSLSHIYCTDNESRSHKLPSKFKNMIVPQQVKRQRNQSSTSNHSSKSACSSEHNSSVHNLTASPPPPPPPNDTKTPVIPGAQNDAEQSFKAEESSSKVLDKKKKKKFSYSAKKRFKSSEEVAESETESVTGRLTAETVETGVMDVDVNIAGPVILAKQEEEKRSDSNLSDTSSAK